MCNFAFVMQLLTYVISKNYQNANIVSNSAVIKPAKLVESLEFRVGMRPSLVLVVQLYLIKDKET